MTKAGSRSSTDTKGLRQNPSPQSRTLTPSIRVDAPHEMDASISGSGADLSADPLAAPADDSAAEQLGLETLQLAAYLSSRQKELDAREAELNSHIASCDSEARAARLWLEQRQADLAVADAALDGQRQELTARAAALDEREAELTRRQRKALEREQALSQRQRALSLREQEFEERLERLAVAETARDKNGEEAAQRCARMRRQTAAGERLAADHNRAAADLERKRQAVQRRAEHVDKCRASLLQLREELGRMHRETLEIRLATEELWVQLSGAAPPAAVTRSLGHIRTRLAEQYAQANAELAEQKKELDTIRLQLNAQLEKLRDQKRLFEQWATARGRDCETQAARLVAREEQLQREENQLRAEADRWRAEQAAFQRRTTAVEIASFQPSPRKRRRGGLAPQSHSVIQNRPTRCARGP